MHSRQHESERELARLGCAHLAGRKAPCILIGGLGMGYTLRQALDMLSPHAQVVVSELLGAVVEWHREYIGEPNGQPLGDKRVDLHFYPIIKWGSQSVTQGTKDTSISIPTSTRKNGSMPLDISSMESPLIAEPTNSE